MNDRVLLPSLVPSVPLRFLARTLGRWHDLPDNASGKLCASLAQDLNTVQALTGEGLGQQILTLATVAMGIFFTFYFGFWQGR